MYISIIYYGSIPLPGTNFCISHYCHNNATKSLHKIQGLKM